MSETLRREFTIELPTDRAIPREAIIQDMQDIAPAGLCSDLLTEQQVVDLRLRTALLVDQYGQDAHPEYLRYLGTEERSIVLDQAKILEQISGKTVLVTGGTGLIGSELVCQLANYSPSRLVTLSRGKTMPHKVTPGVEHAYADVMDSDAVANVMDSVKPDIVYHLAAEKYPGVAEKEVNRTTGA